MPLIHGMVGFLSELYELYELCDLRKETKNWKLTSEELFTLLFEIERIVSNCPITYLYPNDLEPCITPNRLLFGRQLEYLFRNDGTNTINYEFEDIVQYSKNRDSY